MRYEAQRAMAGRVPYLGAIRLDACFLMPRPKSMHKEPLDVEIPHTKDPDTDNLLKAAMDALKMVIWGDDCQVSTIVARKRYVAGDEAPGLYLRFTEDARKPWARRLWDCILNLLRTKETPDGQRSVPHVR